MDAFLLLRPAQQFARNAKEFNPFTPLIYRRISQKRNRSFCIVPAVNIIDAHFAMSIKGDRSLLEKLDKALIQARKSVS